jgi:magnesium-transporting ATPase (P-type)
MCRTMLTLFNPDVTLSTAAHRGHLVTQLGSNGLRLQWTTRDGRLIARWRREPRDLDRAVLEDAERQLELDVLQLADKVDEIPFDFLRRRMSVIVTNPSRERVLICKGAVEEVFTICALVDLGEDVVSFSNALMARHLQRTPYDHESLRR